MSENSLMVKPEFDAEIQAQITSLGEITSNFKTVKDKALELKNFYTAIVYDEDNLETAKKDRTAINKYKESVSKYRKTLAKEFNKPFIDFETLAKETEKILDETAKSIGVQIDTYEGEKINERHRTFEAYFNEYATSLGINFTTYTQMGLHVTLSASEKKLKEEIKAYLDNIASDLQLIQTQEHADEILIEYKDGLDVKNAITKVNMRKKLLEINQKNKEASEEFANNLNKFREPEILQKPVEETVGIEDIKQATFTVKGTMSQLKTLKMYIEENGMQIIK